MTREELMQAASDYMASSAFLETLARRVSYPTESLVAARGPQIMACLTEEMLPSLQALGFEWRIVDNPVAGKWPFLLARRIEPEVPFTLLTYGHGNLVLGDKANWLEGGSFPGKSRRMAIAGMDGGRQITRASTPSTWLP